MYGIYIYVLDIEYREVYSGNIWRVLELYISNSIQPITHQEEEKGALSESQYLVKELELPGKVTQVVYPLRQRWAWKCFPVGTVTPVSCRWVRFGSSVILLSH